MACGRSLALDAAKLWRRTKWDRSRSATSSGQTTESSPSGSDEQESDDTRWEIAIIGAIIPG